jgi:hypothetical protein
MAEIRSGLVARIVEDNLVYVSQGDVTLTFTPAEIEGYNGLKLGSLGILVGDPITYEVEGETSREITRVFLPGRAPTSKPPEGRPRDADNFLRGSLQRARSADATERHELTPDVLPAPNDYWKPDRAIEPRLRAFGKFLATDHLWPGDLVLTREMNPDFVSREIRNVQRDAGYADPADAVWTHAAMYVGDYQRLIESTFDSTFTGQVALANLDVYCGQHGIRIRRSKYVRKERDGWLMVIRALSRIGRPYAMLEAIKQWWSVRVKKVGFWDDQKQYRTGDALMCSTFYADAYNETTRRSLGEMNGVCVPAWLSQSDEFYDLPLRWLAMR